jgi:two-component system cell cycle sensor histidine kinase PleC
MNAGPMTAASFRSVRTLRPLRSTRPAARERTGSDSHGGRPAPVRQQLEKQAQQLVELARNYALEKDRAEDASRIKSEFLANVSHELRTPLNAIIGFSEMMLSGAFGPLGDDRYGEYCQDIRESGTFLLRIISDILDMARLDAGQIEIDREPLHLDLLVHETLQSYSDEAERGGIEVMTTPFRDSPFSRRRRRSPDPVQSRVQRGQVHSARRDDPGANHARPRRGCDRCRRHGDRHPQNAVAKLGRPFEQVPGPLTRSHRGSGLGLAISRSLVRLHGGRSTSCRRPVSEPRSRSFFPTAPERAGDVAAA